jgi:hypothetical protein
MIGGAYYERNRQVEFAQVLAEGDYQNCIASKPGEVHACMQVMNATLSKFMKPDWVGIAFFALAPILMGWIAVYTIIGIVRWIRAGFGPEGKG